MKLSYKWLSEYVDLTDVTPEELANKMTVAGLEVEGVEAMAQGSNLVIGLIVDEKPHPDSDHLHIAQVKISEEPEEIVQIVCGAPNCRSGLKVIVARPGAVLPGGTIEARPVRGQESNGMICALFELGVDKHWLSEAQLNGIEELPEDAPIGETDVFGYLGLDDTILDVSLTPNRADCNAMWNMAKEVGAILHRDVHWPDYAGKANIGDKTDFTVTLATEKCKAFYGKVVNHVKVGPSPKWMVNYLHASGINSINNVVDISNFVMLETGQPLHYYDYSKLPAKEITVVNDREMKMVALDGVEFDIQKGDLLITTGGEATGIAGVMGGEESMIDENTKGIFIEAAAFDAVSIRHTSLRLNLITEAAQHFTKGVEPLAMQKAMDRSVQLLQEYADASGFEETIVVGDTSYEPKVVTETLTHCNTLLGTSFTMDEVKHVLESLDFKPEVDGDRITCHIPSYRMDIERPADIDEEVIRLIGFDSLQSTLPNMEATVGKLSPSQQLRRNTKNYLVGFGLHEIVTYTLVKQEYVEDACMPSGTPIALAMPMSEARKYVRNSLMHSVLECVQYNKAHQNDNCLFYELSSVYSSEGEQERLAIVLDGKLQEDPLHGIDTKADFYALKGILLGWLSKCGFQASRIQIQENDLDTKHFHPYRSAKILLDKKCVGIFGQIHPTLAKQYDLTEVYYAECFLQPVLEAKATKIHYTALDRYPSVSRDIALVVTQDTKAKDILDVIRTAGKKLVRSSEIFDIYEGEHIEKGYKSVALRIIYQASDHTLKEEEISAAHNEILSQLEKRIKAQLRA